MSCPFPGMDPYIERPEIWPDFHDSLISAIRGLLQPLLRPRYAAVTQDRLYFEVWRDEIRQPLIHIVEPAAGSRLVTALEVLSPDNKQSGPGRKSYLRKRDEFYEGGANLVEIDLLRAGEPTVRISPGQMETLQPWHFLVTVTRRWPSRQEVYAIPLQRRLPRIAIPLADDDPDVPLDVQAAFTRCWDEGPYPELLRYDGPPPGAMPDSDIQWCEQVLRAAGLRPQ